MAHRSSRQGGAAARRVALPPGAVLFLGACLGGGCGAPPRDAAAPHTTDRMRASTMDSSTSRLVGTWRMAEPAACAAPYPARLEFQANGLYAGTTDPPGGFTTWDVGTWTVEGGELAMSTANDAVVRYRFTLADDVLRLSDPTGCTFAFRRGP